MFGNIGLPEMIVIMAVALLVFGPKKLPEIGRSLGKAVRDFKKSTEEIKDRFEEQIRVDEFKTLQDDIKDIKKDLTLPDDIKDIKKDLTLQDDIKDIKKDLSQDEEGQKNS